MCSVVFNQRLSIVWIRLTLISFLLFEKKIRALMASFKRGRSVGALYKVKFEIETESE